MKYSFLLLVFFVFSCSSNKPKDLIRGKWYFENSDTYIKITKEEYTVKNDSPIPEDYKLIDDTILIKGVEASIRQEGYYDTLFLIKLTRDTLIMRHKEDTLFLHKK
jgi:hypothetical protein